MMWEGTAKMSGPWAVPVWIVQDTEALDLTTDPADTESINLGNLLGGHVSLHEEYFLCIFREVISERERSEGQS